MTTRPLTAALLALALTGAATAQDYRPIAFTNARIVTISGDTIENGTLVVRHGKIEAVGKDIAAPAGAKIVDATGKTIMPGLVCASSNAGLVSNNPRPTISPRRGRRGRPFQMPTSRGGGAANKAATKVVDGLYARQKVFGELLEVGITSLALTPPGNAFPGLGAILAPDGTTIDALTADGEAFVQVTMARDSATKKLLKDNFEKAKKIVEERNKPKEQPKPAAPATKPEEEKPTEAAKPAATEKGKEPPPAPKPEEEKPATPPQQPKPEPQPSKPEAKKDPNLELLADLLEGKQRAIVTMSSGADLLHWNDAVDAEVKFTRTLVISRHDPFSGTVDMVLDDIKQLGCAVLLPPQLTVKGRSRSVIHPAKILHDAGVEIGFLTGDSPAAVRLLFFQLMEQVRCGLPADVALEGVTLAPAKALGIDKAVGSIEAGKDANLLVFRGDPLSPSAELDAVWFRGRAVDKKP